MSKKKSSTPPNFGLDASLLIGRQVKLVSPGRRFLGGLRPLRSLGGGNWNPLPESLRVSHWVPQTAQRSRGLDATPELRGPGILQ